MSRRRCPSGSLIDDIVAVAAHQTEEIAFLREALSIVAGFAANKGDGNPQRQLAAIKTLAEDALSMQGGAEK